MLRYALLALLLVAAWSLLAQQNNQDFPATWQGEWQGELIISRDTGIVQRLPMILRILPQADGRFSYTIVYGEDTAENTRPYFLETVDSAKGHYVTNEENGILLDDFLINGKLYSRFEVMGTLLLATLEEQNGTLIYEIIAGPLAPLRTTGDTIVDKEEIPPVDSYQINVQQRAVLEKRLD